MAAPSSAAWSPEGIELETLFAQASASPPPPVEHFYYAVKEKVPLEITRAQLAVFHLTGGDPTDISPLLAAAGHPDAQAEPLGPGWTFFALPSASATLAVAGGSGAEDLISDLIFDLLALDVEQRFFVSPVYGGSGCLVIAPWVWVRFVNGVTDAEIEALLTAAGAMDLVWSPVWGPFGGMENARRIHGHLRSAFHVLAIANRLAPMDEVIYASPGAIVTCGGGGGHGGGGSIPTAVIPVASAAGYATLALVIAFAGFLLLRR